MKTFVAIYDTAGLGVQHKLEKMGYMKTAQVCGGASFTIAGAMLGGLAVRGPAGCVIGALYGLGFWIVADIVVRIVP